MRFIRIQNYVNITERWTLSRAVCFIQSPKRTHREVIVTFDMHPAIAVAKLNNKYKTSRVTRVTLVLWIGNKTLRELSRFGNASGCADCLKPL